MLVKVNTLEKFADRLNDPTAELVLRTVSQFLTAGMREMDMVARYQNDTFAVLLPGTPLEPDDRGSRAIASGRGPLPFAWQGFRVANLGQHRPGRSRAKRRFGVADEAGGGGRASVRRLRAKTAPISTPARASKLYVAKQAVAAAG